jgi:hypothetical protein
MSENNRGVGSQPYTVIYWTLFVLKYSPDMWVAPVLRGYTNSNNTTRPNHMISVYASNNYKLFQHHCIHLQTRFYYRFPFGEDYG